MVFPNYRQQEFSISAYGQIGRYTCIRTIYCIFPLKNSVAQHIMEDVLLQVCRRKLAVDVCDFSAQDCTKAFLSPQGFSPYAGDGTMYHIF